MVVMVVVAVGALEEGKREVGEERRHAWIGENGKQV